MPYEGTIMMNFILGSNKALVAPLVGATLALCDYFGIEIDKDTVVGIMSVLVMILVWLVPNKGDKQ